MSSTERLRELITERLTAAAQEIFGAFEKTIVEYEEELERQRRLLDLVWKPEVRLHRIEELPQQPVCTDQQVRKGLERPWSSQGAEQLVLKQETFNVLLIPPCDEGGHSEAEPAGHHSEAEPAGHHHLLSHSSPVAGSPNRKGRRDAKWGSTANAKPKTRRHKSHRNNVESSPLSKVYFNAHTELPQQHVCKKEEQDESPTDEHLCNHERNSSLEPDPLLNKEEQEELCASQEEERLVQKETDNVNMLISTYEESDHRLLSHVSSVAHNVHKSPPSEPHCNSHTADNAFKCDTCGKTLKHRSSYNIHLRSHTGEKPYVCNTCKKRFLKKASLMMHVRIHTGERPYVCKTCWKSFNNSSNFTVHLRLHTGDRPYVCNTCGKRFCQNIHLRRHIRTHEFS